MVCVTGAGQGQFKVAEAGTIRRRLEDVLPDHRSHQRKVTSHSTDTAPHCVQVVY